VYKCWHVCEFLPVVYLKPAVIHMLCLQLMHWTWIVLVNWCVTDLLLQLNEICINFCCRSRLVAHHHPNQLILKMHCAQMWVTSRHQYYLTARLKQLCTTGIVPRSIVVIVASSCCSYVTLYNADLMITLCWFLLVPLQSICPAVYFVAVCWINFVWLFH